jgi:hypothetical protein
VIFKSPIFAQASGSIAGTVFSRNAGGMYVRSRANPTNPNTDAQQAVRDAMRQLVVAWTSELDDGQRDAWNTYAFNTPTLNKLGEPTTKTGQQMYIRGNIARIQAVMTRADDAPSVFNVGDFTPPGAITADASASNIVIPFEDADEWANEDDSAMLVYQSRPQNATRTFGKGPFQLLTKITGGILSPPTSPVTVTSLFPMTAGQKVFFQVRVTRADGRLSGKVNPTTIVVT